ncbi:MAG: hypothetical protein H7Z40_05175 [Phycisphaerae bacterium]|nr:hypothetical protein [Gemmatimonadaceae bacterium]
MIRWLIALIVGAVVAWIAYGRAGTSLSARTALLAALRGLAVMLVAALLLGAPAGQSRAAPALVAFDASASWLRAAAGDSTLVRDALRAALKEAASDSVMLTGDSLRMMTSGNALEAPINDGLSSLRPAIDRAAALSRPLILLTDGEVDDPTLVADMPAGSRIVVPARVPAKDAALSALESPFTVNAGDTLSVAVVVVAGGAGADKGTLRLLLDGQPVGTAPLTPLGAYASRRSIITLPLPRGAKKSLLQAVVDTDNDAEIRNDTLGMALDIGDKPAAVFISTSPDLDVREALSVLRGALDVPARAYLRIAPGAWREEGSLRPVTEADVRARLQGAGLVIVHGDTSWGGVSARTRGAHALWAPASPTAVARAGENARLAEWYVTGAPASPLMGALAGLPWDTLPPITAAAPAKGSFTVLEARLGKTGAPVSVIAGRENAGFRTLLISGSGFAGWSLRGGRSQAAFVALWGAMFDWLAAARGDVGAARPVAAVARSGEPVRWRRGGTDSVVTAVVTQRLPVGEGKGDTVRLRFTNADVETVSPSLAVGVYDVRTTSASSAVASSVLVVNQSRELIPRAPALATSVATRGLSAGAGPRLSDLGWMFGVALLLLCAEWLLRRNAGLR